MKIAGKTRLSRGFAVVAVAAFAVALIGSSRTAQAASAKEINIKVDGALTQFYKDVSTGREFVNNAKGVLVFPEILKAGMIAGGEYGEGALRVGGKTVDYYSTAAASIGLQFGAQSKSVIIVFLDSKALSDFRNSTGWEVGVDGSVALITVGAGGTIDTNSIKDPIVAFVFNNKGLMYNLTLEGTKMTKIVR